MIVRWLLPCLIVGSFVAHGRVATAASDTAQFVEAMRAQGHFDLTLEYLDSIADSRLVTDEFKQRVGYERGVTLLAKWQKTASATERRRIAQQIAAELKSFAQANPDSPLAPQAQRQLAVLLSNTASRDIAVIEMRPTSESKEAEVRAEAVSQLKEARKLMVDAEKAIVAALAKFPKQLDRKTEADKIDRQRELREELAQVRLLRSQALQQLANAHGPKARDFKKLHEEATAEFQDLYDKYTNFLPGFMARVYQGQSYLELGKLKEASGCFEDVIVQGAEAPALRDLVTKALAYQAECYLAEKEFDQIIAKQGAWLTKAHRAEARQPDWLRLKYFVAEAKRHKATDNKLKEAPRKRLLTEARSLYSDVALQPSEFQRPSQEVLKELGGPAQQDKPAPKTFDEALAAGKRAISELSATRQQMESAGEEGSEDSHLQESLSAGFREATMYLDAALSLVDDDTPIEQVNEARRLMAWLLWQDEQYHRSAVLASFLARRYPEDPSSSSAAQVALSSYDKIYRTAREANDPDAGDAEAERLKDLARFITRRWGSTALSDMAFGVLLDFSIREKQFEASLELLEELDDTRRASYRARIANAMWETQLRAANEQDDSIDRAALRQQATQLLKESFEPLKDIPAARSTLAATSLYLAQSLIDEGEYAAAIKVLEDRKAGPLALVKTNDPIASRPAYAIEAYKNALRAYVSVVPSQSDKAIETMTALEKAAKKSGGGENLTRVYLGLGLQLQQQIATLNEEGKGDDAQQVGEAFAAFLDKLNERGSDDPSVGRWIAQTYFKLAEGMESEAPKRGEYYQRANDAYKVLLEGNADPKATLALQMQYAQTLRQLGQYEQAVAMFEKVLAEREMLLDVQKAAAYTLQEWGEATSPDKFKEAVSGRGQLNAKGKPVIWGWSQLGKVAVQVARTRPEYKTLFYECWLNQARIRYLTGMQTSGEARTKQLDSARGIVSTMVRNYSDFKQTELRADFDLLMKQIQQAEGKRPTGLAEFGDDS